AKAKPGSMNYGSSGLGSIHHLTTEAMKAAFGLDIVHVPFKGMGQAVPALLGGQVSMLFSALPAIEAHVKAGKVKLLAISVPQRLRALRQGGQGFRGEDRLRLSITASSVRRVAATSAALAPRTAIRFTSSASGTSFASSARPLRVR